jgi:PAS domain S-box-containing protein
VPGARPTAGDRHWRTPGIGHAAGKSIGYDRPETRTHPVPIHTAMTDPHPPAADPDPDVLRIAVEAAGLWPWRADLVADTTVFQDGFWETFGHHHDGPVETFDFLPHMHRGDQKAVTRAWRAHLDGETEMYESEWRLRTATGEWRWIRSRGKVTERAPGGAHLRMVGVYMDVTREKQAQQALAESRAETEAVFRGSRDAMMIVDSSLVIRRINARAGRLFERVTGTAVVEGTGLLDYPFFRESRPFLNEVQNALSGKTFSIEREFRIPGLAPGWVEGAFSPVLGIRGEVIGATVAIRDITERKRLEQARVQALKLESLGLMASGIAHDFNNLLTVIAANIELAAMDATPDELDDYLAEARGAATRASELVEQLLTFAGKRERNTGPVDVSALAAEVAAYARKLPGAPIRIDQEFAQVPPVEADAVQLRQLVLNLLVNAVEATRGAGSRIVVRTATVDDPGQAAPSPLVQARPASKYVMVQVTDDGAGIDAETRTRIFDPFFTTKEAGHGLGLASALGAVRAHGGAIALESEPGRGSTFTVLLPAS